MTLLVDFGDTYVVWKGTIISHSNFVRLVPVVPGVSSFTRVSA